LNSNLRTWRVGDHFGGLIGSPAILPYSPLVFEALMDKGFSFHDEIEFSEL